MDEYVPMYPLLLLDLEELSFFFFLFLFPFLLCNYKRKGDDNKVMNKERCKKPMDKGGTKT